MKRFFICIVTAALFLVGCDKTLQPEQTAPTQLKVAFSLDHPDGPATKVVKKGWEAGDVVFIFFEDIGTGYLKMAFDGSAWTSTLEGSMEVGELSPADKHLTAVYLPFGNDEKPTYESESGVWFFGKCYLSYHLAAEKVSYTVETTGDIATLDVPDSKLTMALPDNRIKYVQFYIEDASAADGKAYLSSNYLRAYDVGGVNSTLSPFYNQYEPGDFIPGYAYKGGYLFCGALSDDAIGTAVDYDFTLLVGSEMKIASKKSGVMFTSDSKNRSADITGLTWEVPVPTAVDLGLPSGRKWADRNLGAGFPIGFGDYFSWGNTSGQPYLAGFSPSFDVDGNPYLENDGSNILALKYCTEEELWGGLGPIDGARQLEESDDAAAVQLGDGWHIPSMSDFEELADPDNTTLEWKTNYLNSGVSGLLVTGIRTGKSIFLPGAGFGLMKFRFANPLGIYWTSMLQEDNCLQAQFISFSDAKIDSGSYPRYYGCSIRPVK